MTNILSKEQLTYYINSNAKVERYLNILIGNLQSKRKCKSNKLKVVKRIIKFYFVAPDLDIVRAVIKKAPNAVIRAISNGALNCRQGAEHILPHLIPLFKHYNHYFDYLIYRRTAIPSKRHLINQKGDALPIIF